MQGDATLVADPAASNGCAAKLVGSNTTWNVQCPIQPAWEGTWHCYATVRTDDTTNSFGLGISGGVETDFITPVDGEYHTYDLGVHQLTKDMFFFVGPSGLGSDIYIDRFFLVPAATAKSVADLRSLPAKSTIQLTTPAVVTTAPGIFTDGSMYI
ncbi:MAG TPA: hypothetical protein VHV83_22170, partial [Armatimonadota bacterium]|nr:hypothetical protein [Armatimonadota bacterium]